MTQSTRETVLEAAIDLFAQHGYEAASMQAIAQAVGVTKAALYKHFASKAGILEALANRMAAIDAERAVAFDLPVQSKKDSPRAYRRASLENLARFALAQFEFWTVDPFASRFRRMLVLEQWRSGRTQELWRQHFLGPADYVADIFESLDISSAQSAATAYWGGMFLAFSLYDAAQNEAERQSVRLRLQEHIDTMTRRLTKGK